MSAMSPPRSASIAIALSDVPNKKCHNCSNPVCPYPEDEDYRQKVQADPSWRLDKDCWMPFPEEQAAALGRNS